ncbi:MAG: hypothetical protein ABSG57_13875 [Candidatus Bathyarchaeia archaeon]
MSEVFQSTLNDNLEKRFREEAFKRLNMKKGNSQVAIEKQGRKIHKSTGRALALF